MEKPSIAELRQLLAEAEAAEAQEKEQLRTKQRKDWDLILENPNSFEWKVKAARRYRFGKGYIEGIEVSLRIKPEILEAWKKNGLPDFDGPFQQEDRWYETFYIRTDENILTNEGGGHHILHIPKLCSDEEWNEMLEGRIPNKFKRF